MAWENIGNIRGPAGLGVPAGGTTGQVLAKTSNADNATAWVDASAGPAGPVGPQGPPGTPGVGVPAGGTTGQVLAKDTDVDFATEWIDPPASGTVDHGALTGLADDDHTQYLNSTRHNAAAHSTIPVSALAPAAAVVNMNSWRITNLADPVAATDGANKQYVDNLVAGLAWKDSVRAASGINLSLSGGAILDNVTVVSSDRVLVKNQTNPAENGIYIVSTAGAWTRANDANTGAELLAMAVLVEEGNLWADTAWVCTANAPIAVGTTPLPFVQFSGGAGGDAGGLHRYATTPPSDLVDGQLYFDSDLAIGGPSGGFVAYAETTTPVSGIGTSPTDIGVSVTFTVNANRRYKVTFGAPIVQNTSTGTPQVGLYDGANTLQQLAFQVLGAGVYACLGSMIVKTFAAGSLTLKLRAFTSAATMSTAVGAGQVANLLVEDIGGV